MVIAENTLADLIFYSEVNFVIDNKTYICPVMKQRDGNLRLYINVDVFDALYDNWDLKYSSPLNYKYNNYNCYILTNKNVSIKYYNNSNNTNTSNVIIIDNVCKTKKFVVNYNDGLFDFLSSSYNIIKDCVRMTMHVCSSQYENNHIIDVRRWSHNHIIEAQETKDIHCVLESYDITDKIQLLQRVMKLHTQKSVNSQPEIDYTVPDMDGEYTEVFSYRNINRTNEITLKTFDDKNNVTETQVPRTGVYTPASEPKENPGSIFNDMSYYPIVEYMKDHYTINTDDETEANRLSNLGLYGVMNLGQYLLDTFTVDDVNNLGLYIIFECEYIKHDYKYNNNTIIGLFQNGFEDFDDTYIDSDVIINELSYAIPLNVNDFILCTNSKYNKIYFEEYMERHNKRDVIIFKNTHPEKIEYKDVIIKQPIMVPTFYQTIVDDTILRINKNRYNIGIDVFALNNIVKDMVLYIVFDNVKFPEIGRDVNNVIFEIDGNLIKKEKGVINIVDENDNVIFTQNYIIE